MNKQSFYVERTLKAANYLLDNKTTIDKTADALFICRSTVQQDLKNRLPNINKELAEKVQKHLLRNKNMALTKNSKPIITVECECTSCKFNNAQSAKDVGYCTRKTIKLKYRELYLEDGDMTDVNDCQDYQFKYKGKEFIEG